MKEVLVSIIIPCHNHGKFLGEAIESVTNEGYPFGYEIIIVNDGSTDSLTLDKINTITDERIKIIHQQNSGPSIARNTAIKSAKGQFILPLDSDNKLSSNYLLKGVDLLSQNPEIDIVHAKGQRFGLKDHSEVGKKLDIRQLVQYNTIDTCAIYRKSVWEQVGGYDEFLSKRGLEDWDFWLGCAEKGFNFYFIDEVLFYYRETEDSRTFQVANKNLDSLVSYIRQKHSSFIIETLLGYKVDYVNLLKSREYTLGSEILKPVRRILSLFR